LFRNKGGGQQERKNITRTLEKKDLKKKGEILLSPGGGEPSFVKERKGSEGIRKKKEDSPLGGGIRRANFSEDSDYAEREKGHPPQKKDAARTMGGS